MVVASPNAIGIEKLRAVELPVIDLSAKRPEVAELIVKASQEYGFFKVVNHGVPEDVIKKMEEESFNFFRKPASEKKRLEPLGYGCKNIGFNGDMGEVEYLLFNTNPRCISQRSETISNDPTRFRYFLLFFSSFSLLNFSRVLQYFLASIPPENFGVLRGFIFYIH